jgi:hypothetical protein
LDSEGLSYISGSYHALGNNGMHQCCSNSITTGTGAAPNVLAAIGADESDVIASLSVDLSGSFPGVDEPLGGGSRLWLPLDTSSVGIWNGVLTVESSRQAVANGLFQLPFRYTVVAVPEPPLGVMAIGVAAVASRTSRSPLCVS